MFKISFPAMGSSISVLMDTDSPTAHQKIAEVPSWFERWESIFSRFRSTSELSFVNQNAGLPIRVSAVFLEVLQASLDAASRSNGMVTPTLLRSLEFAGYNQSFDHMPRDMESFFASQSLGGSDYRSIQINPIDSTILIPPDIQLDFGGIAKGWAAQQAAVRLAEFAPALVNAGGDIVVSGALANGEPWLIGIDDPFNPGEERIQIKLFSGSVATSGKDRRHWHKNGYFQHHILNPFTGQPAQSDVWTATAVANNAVDAEMVAKTAIILGSRSGLAWIDEKQDISAFFILENGESLSSRNFKERFGGIHG
jgi:thiamine biosynthesis lipoprotein